MTSSAAMQATTPTFSDGRQGRHAADRPMGMVTSNGIAAARKFDDRAPATKKRKRHGHLTRGASHFWGTFCDHRRESLRQAPAQQFSRSPATRGWATLM